MVKRVKKTKSVLKLPDLDYLKSAVLNSLRSLNSRRSQEHAIFDFIEWYCSVPRLAFNKTVVTRYRIALEQRRYAPLTINLRLAAVRRLAYEASDCRLLSPDLDAGIRRVKEAKRLGIRVGHWLTIEQGKKLLAVHFESNCETFAIMPSLPCSSVAACVERNCCRQNRGLREEHWVLAETHRKGSPYANDPCA